MFSFAVPHPILPHEKTPLELTAGLCLWYLAAIKIFRVNYFLEKKCLTAKEKEAFLYGTITSWRVLLQAFLFVKACPELDGSLWEWEKSLMPLKSLMPFFSLPRFLSKALITLISSGGIRPGTGKTEILAVLCHRAMHSLLVFLSSISIYPLILSVFPPGSLFVGYWLLVLHSCLSAGSLLAGPRAEVVADL